jgi:RimJ/RimL family protein N-acetyltransferase
MQTFDTPRLQVRPLADGDEALYCRLYTDPVVMRFIVAPLSQGDAQRSFDIALRHQLPRPQRWIVREKNSGADIGLLGLIGAGEGPEIGVVLLADSHGCGYGTEAMAGLVEYAFATTNLQTISACQAVPDNPTVVDMMSRLGFTALPPTPARPAGGDWLLHRMDWRGPPRRAPVAAADADR